MDRFFDILFSSFAILVFIPLFFLISIILFFTGEGEILYLQERIGKNTKSFKLIKFATMLKNSPNMGTKTITLKNDERILPIGGFLRKTKINELPQLFNILKGDMSLVGPRPLTFETFNFYSDDKKKTITSIRPGLSGIGSIVFRNEEDILIRKKDEMINFYKNNIAPYKGSIEKWYIQNKTIKNYFLIIFITIIIVIYPRSKIHWKLFKDLPLPPKILKNLI